MNKYDAIVIGAGHNGLVAAAYLAKAGRSVLVLERRSMVGGATVTEELIPGFRFSTASYIISLFRNDIIKDLSLAEHGYRSITYDPTSCALFPDGSSIRFWSSLDQTLSEIRRFSKADADAYVRFGADLAEFGSRLEPLLGAPPPSWDAIGQAFSGARGRELFTLFACLSVRDLVNHYFESPFVRGPLIHMSMVSVLAFPGTPETAYQFGHHATGQLDGKYGRWGYVQGGMGGLAEALASAAREAGADIRTDAAIDKILISDQRVAGVRLSSGEAIESKVVLSSVDLRNTLEKLTPASALPEEPRRQASRYEFRGAMARVFYALSDLPVFPELSGTAPADEHQGLMVLGGTDASYTRAFHEMAQNRIPSEPPIHLTIPSVRDDTLAPPGKHTLITGIQQLPYELEGTSWEAERHRFAEAVTSRVAARSPNFRDAIIDTRVLTPVDYEEVFGLTEGNIFHGSMTFAQLFANRPIPGWANYRMPVEGLYLCGSSAHPGGGVTGLPGKNAAFEAVRDWPDYPLGFGGWSRRAAETSGGGTTAARFSLAGFASWSTRNPILRPIVMRVMSSPRLRWLSSRLQDRLLR